MSSENSFLLTRGASQAECTKGVAGKLCFADVLRESVSKGVRGASFAVSFLGILTLLLFAPRLSLAEEFRVGAILNLSGYGARWGENAKRGILLAQEERNAAGGIAGQQIRIVFEDARSGDLTSAAVAAQKLISVDKVQAILTQWPAETEVVWSIAMRAGVPVISTSAGAPNLVRGRSFLIRTWGDDSALIERTVQAIVARGLKSPFVLVGQDPYFLELAKELRRELSEVGKPLVGEIEVRMDEQDLRGSALKVKAAHPDAIVSLITYSQQAALLKRLSDLEVNSSANFGILGSDDPSFLALAGAAAEGLLIPTYRSVSEEFDARFLLRWGELPWLAADTSYDALMLVAEAARRREGGSDLYTELLSITNFPGASGEISILPSGERLPRRTQILKIEGDRFLPLIN